MHRGVALDRHMKNVVLFKRKGGKGVALCFCFKFQVSSLWHKVLHRATPSSFLMWFVLKEMHRGAALDRHMKDVVLFKRKGGKGVALCFCFKFQVSSLWHKVSRSFAQTLTEVF